MAAPQLSVGLGGSTTGIRWGSFWYADGPQSVPSANGTAVVSLNYADPANNGVSMVSGNQMTFAYGGVYSVTYSIQFANSDSQIHDAQVWLRKNGLTSTFDVADSNSRFAITSKHGSTNGHVIGTVNYVLPLNAGDYLALAWSTQDVLVIIDTIPAQVGTPTIPRTPGVILTAVQV